MTRTTPDSPWLLPAPKVGTLPARSQAEELRVVELEGEAAASAARRLVRGELAAWGLEDLIDGVLLVVSELTTNGVLHGRGPGSDMGRVTLTIARYSDMIAVGVEDQNLARPVPREPGPDATGGRGLQLVTTLSDHLTIGPTETCDGKRITAYWRSDGTARCLQEATEPALAT
ncbi:ATP-binding protein [Kitasatospora sp. NPDC094028]